MIRFEWDEDKNRENIAKHGVSFEDATRIFERFTLDVVDDRFDYGELREISIGRIRDFVIVTVVHTDRDGTCRIISAREADRRERRAYEKALRKTFDA